MKKTLIFPLEIEISHLMFLIQLNLIVQNGTEKEKVHSLENHIQGIFLCSLFNITVCVLLLAAMNDEWVLTAMECGCGCGDDECDYEHNVVMFFCIL